MKFGHRILHEPSRRAAAALAMEGQDAYDFGHKMTFFDRTKSECASPGEGSTKAWRSILSELHRTMDTLTYTSFSVARAVYVILIWRPDLLFSTAVFRGTKSWKLETAGALTLARHCCEASDRGTKLVALEKRIHTVNFTGVIHKKCALISSLVIVTR